MPGRGDGMGDCLEKRLQDAYGEIYTVHRLDMETSGLIIYARNSDVQKALSQLFMNKQVKKNYIADLYGYLEGEKGEVYLPLICDWPNRPRQKVDYQNGKPAETHWRVIKRDNNTTHVELTPITGRSHQLRVHMLELGYPILGDSLYAHDDAYHPYNRLHLHASDIDFTHPVSGKTMSFSSKPNF